MIGSALTILGICLALGIPVAATLFFLGYFLAYFYSPMPLVAALGETAWTSTTGFLLVTIPLFVLMGEIILRAGIAGRMYNALAQWLTWLPGGLMHANIAACTVFAATSGSSAATAATIGTVAMPEIDRHRYSPPLFLGTIAAGGTLGILIPPSINLIIYGVITDTSIPQLYLAGILPGLILAVLFMGLVVILCLVRPEWRGVSPPADWRGRLLGLLDLLPPLAIFVVVIGSIYAGWATPTESAALGVVSALVLAAAYRNLNMRILQAAFEGTIRTTAMIMLIILASFFLNFVMAAIGLVHQVNSLVSDLQMSPLAVLLSIIVFYIILGCFMETLSMMITTLPIVAPIVVGLGYDPVWFGIVMMILIETALITPPVGVNLFIVQGVRGKGSINQVMLGALPFTLTMFILIALLIAFPSLALWFRALAP